jgi:hypothetical protein
MFTRKASLIIQMRLAWTNHVVALVGVRLKNLI